MQVTAFTYPQDTLVKGPNILDSQGHDWDAQKSEQMNKGAENEGLKIYQIKQ